MKMTIVIHELEHMGKPATCTLRAIQYNARTRRWTADALWRGHELFRRGQVTADTFEALVVLTALQDVKK